MTVIFPLSYMFRLTTVKKKAEVISPIYYCICLEAVFWLKWHKIHWETRAMDLINMQPSLLWSRFWLCCYGYHNKKECYGRKIKRVFVWKFLGAFLAPTKLLPIVGTRESKEVLHTLLAAAVSWDGSCYSLQHVDILKNHYTAYSSVYYVNMDDLGNCFSFAAYQNLLVYFNFSLFPFTLYQTKNQKKSMGGMT